MTMATRTPTTYHCPAPRWSLDDLVAARQPDRRAPMSRSSLWRLLAEADLQPHRSVYGLNRHDPDCEAQAQAICALSRNALDCLAHDRVVMCPDAQTGMQMLHRQDPPPPLVPGKPENRAHESLRHGGRAWIAALVVATGQGVGHVGPTRTSADVAAHRTHVVTQLPAMRRDDGVVDQLHTHGSRAVCRLVAQWCAVP